MTIRKLLCLAALIFGLKCRATNDVGLPSAGGWPTQSFKTEPDFHPPVLRVVKTGETAPGLLFFSPGHVGDGPANPAIMTEEGELVWLGPPGPDVTNFNLQKFNEVDYLHWFSGNLSRNDFKHAYGSVSILDREYKQPYRICLPDLNFVTPDSQKFPCYNDLHESEFYTPRGTILVTAYNITRHDLRLVGGGPDELTLDSQFYEIDIATNKILFRWSSLNHTDQLPITWSHYPLDPPNSLGTGLEGTRQTVAWDYFHINSIQALEDGYLLSSRHFWQAVKLNRHGKVDWILDGANLHGNFTLDPAGFFKWQHHMRIPEEGYNPKNKTQIIHFHDNDNNEVSNGTRPGFGFEFLLNLETKKASVLRSLINKRRPVFPLQEGSYQTLPNGNALVGHGAVPIIEEYGRNDEIHYTATFGITNITHSYRAFKYNNWHAVPYYPPKVVALKQKTSDSAPGAYRDGGTTAVYMSWNGATDVSGWEILAGESPEMLKTVGFTEKKGFETEFVVPAGAGAVEYVQVKAYEGNKFLRASEVVRAG